MTSNWRCQFKTDLPERNRQADGLLLQAFVMPVDLAFGTTTGINARCPWQVGENSETTHSGRNSLPAQLWSPRPPQPFGRRWIWPLAPLPVDLAAGTVPAPSLLDCWTASHLQASAIPAKLQANNLQQHRRPLHHVCAADQGEAA